MRKLLIMACATLVSAPALAEFENAPLGPIESLNVVAGAGFGGFTSDFGTVSNTGVTWQVRAGIVMYKYLGFEANYQGESSSVSAVIVPTGAPLSGSHLTENQITANFVPGYSFMIGDHELRPYGVAGIGYGHIGVDDTLGVIGLSSESAAAFPFGVGASFNITPMFLVDARYTTTSSRSRREIRGTWPSM